MLKKSRITIVIGIALLPLLVLSMQAFGQATSSIGGTISDAQQAVIPNATVKVTSVQTGISTSTTSNNAGYYNFPSLQPGTYTVVAEAKGFQKTTKTDVKLGVAAQVRLNVEMMVSGGSTEIEVTTSAENMILDQSSSTGTVLQEDLVSTLPLASNDVMELLNVMGGVVKNEDNPVFGASNQTFAGVAGTNVNIQRDGITVSEVRYNSGVNSPARMNPEMVGEMKMILSPVDAEMGRGAGQVQIITKSGANAFHGSGVWNVQNTALDSVEWNVKTSPTNTRPDWRNLNDYTLSLSGPIIKNKTFFFVNWEQQIVRIKQQAYPRVLTDCARLGIFRYLADPSVTPSNLPWMSNYDRTKQIVHGGKYSLPAGGYSLNGAAYMPGVDFNGVPVADTATNKLMAESVLGIMTSDARTHYAAAPNCSDPWFAGKSPMDLVTTGTNWDTNRSAMDTTGYIEKFNAIMPRANYFGVNGISGGDTTGYYNISDGLNVAKHQWTRVMRGLDTMWGIASDNDKKAITAKIDHNISNAHRISGMLGYERNFGGDAFQLWPTNAYGGSVERYPINTSITLTSTLRPTLLNEFRAGYSRTLSHTFEPTTVSSTGPQLVALLKELSTGVTTGGAYADQPLVINAGDGGQFSTNKFYWSEGDYYGNSHPYGGRNYNLTSTQGGKDARWSLSDTVTWTKGTHSFKGGFEYRLSESFQEQNGNIGDANTFATVNGGVMSNWKYNDLTFSKAQNPADPRYATEQHWVRAAGNDQQTSSTGVLMDAQGLLNYMAGGVGSINQYFYVNSAKDRTWNNAAQGQLMQNLDLLGREFSFFFKDDWKVSSSLTLNLGVRYEYYGVPWIDSGMTGALKGGALAAFGISGANFSNWMHDIASRKTTGTISEYQFVGPNSPNPDLSPWEKDMNNFAPHVGFAWQLPWFGKGKTTLRGGYSVSYSPVGNFGSYGTQIGFVPGVTNVYRYTGGSYVGLNSANAAVTVPDQYVNLANVKQYLPLNPSTANNVNAPLTSPNINAYSGSGGTVYDNNIRNPYVQSINLSMTRNIGNNLTLDVRYVATLSRKSTGSINVNTVNLVKSGMADVLKRVRLGTETRADMDYLTQFVGYNRSTTGPYAGKGYLWQTGTYTPVVGAVTDTNFSHFAADQIRNSTTTKNNLIQGNFQAIATSIGTGNGNMSAFNNGMPIVAGTNGNLVRQSCADAGITQITAVGTTGTNVDVTCATAFIANPQYSSISVTSNLGHSNYHSMQAGLSMKPTRGLSFQTTYTWSRNLADSNPNDWESGERLYYLSSQHRTHQLTSYGTFDLPMGANGFILRNASGVLKKAIEGWTLSWVGSLTSGAPLSITGNISNFWGDNNVNLVDPSAFDRKGGRASWKDTYTNSSGVKVQGHGYYFDDGTGMGINKYTTVVDTEKCNQLHRDLQGTCKGTSASTALLQALALTSDPTHLVFRNADPMTHGNFARNELTGPGKWNLDMAMGKSLEFMEGKRIEFRVDAQNIFNHAVPSAAAGSDGGGSQRNSVVTNPSFTLGGFGALIAKAGHRTFQAKIRISF